MLFSTYLVPDLDSGSTTSGQRTSEHSSVVLLIVVMDVFHGEGLLFNIALRVFLANAKNNAMYLGSFLIALIWVIKAPG
ncbi:hypothetical protein DPMN_174452 [Dreissena polymorpha]|uniref:Uncharacterized protein n=1 Tax=Dreissena polymorpha TaxID=45954 RepID=A0A9D4E747_DREPO|nr:hypothetical protein DPMN_174452 [Dreissena polymorpha]